MASSAWAGVRLRAMALMLTTVSASACFDDPYRSFTGGLGTVDAGTPGQRRFGNLLFFESKFLGQETEYGDGPFILIGPFQIKDEQIDPVYEEAEGSPFACKVTVKTPEQVADPGVDIGTLNFTATGGRVIPPCKIVDGEWACIGTTGSGGDIALVDDVNHIYSLTDPGAGWTDDDVGRVLKINGATNAVNDGMFSIVAKPSADTIHFYNPRPGAAEAATPASYRTEYGEGPARESNPFDDDESLTMTLDAGGEGNFDDFSKTVEFGDSFTLDTASQGLINNIPLDGSEFSIGCDGDGGDCGAARASGVVIETTDADLDPAFPGAFPPPVNKQVIVFCLLLIGRGTVPPEASAYIADSGATRIRAIFVRGIDAQEIQDYAEITTVAGHAVIGFTDP